MSGGLASAASHLELGGFGTWVGAHKGGLRAAGFVVAALILLALPGPRTVSALIWLVVLIVVWLVAVEFFGSAGSASPEAVAPVVEGVTVEEAVASEDADTDAGHEVEPDGATAAKDQPDSDPAEDEPTAV